MASSESLKDIGKPLDVTEKDVKDVKKAASKQRLTHVVKLGLPILSFILALLIGRMANPPSTLNDTYPFLGAAGAQFSPRTPRRLTWTATILLSVVLYIFGLLLYESMVRENFGVAYLYGPHSR